MDDFGTKYSNVAMLAHMGFDIIKFDKSMINDITVRSGGSHGYVSSHKHVQ